MKLKTRRSIVLLLLCLLIAPLAMAVYDQDIKAADYLRILEQEDFAEDIGLLTTEGFNCGWEVFESWPGKGHSALRTSSQDPASVVSDTILLGDSYIQDSRANSKKLNSINRDYSSRMDLILIDLENVKTPVTGKDLNRSIQASDVKYIYEREVNSNWQRKWIADERYYKYFDQYPSNTSKNEIQFAHTGVVWNNYPYNESQILDDGGNTTLKEIYQDPVLKIYQEWFNKLASGREGGDEDHASIISDSFDGISLGQKQITKTSEPFEIPAQYAMSSNLTTENLNRLVLSYDTASTIFSANGSDDINYANVSEVFSFAGHQRSRQKNYAVIVGIDEYKDRTSLHKCVNDANSIADLMRTLGYEVILLSDNSEKKPTKRNILDVALKDINQKQPDGNIIFYFSGHGMLGHDNTFYLIPQDSNGDTASYISEYELKRYIKDLDNLALIIDACDSEGLSDSVGKGQLIIASSKKNEASNEEWVGSLSVFTSKLIGAIREEGQMSNKILLQKCFSRAYNDTIKWGQGRLLRQTPVLIDRSGGRYYIR